MKSSSLSCRNHHHLITVSGYRPRCWSYRWVLPRHLLVCPYDSGCVFSLGGWNRTGEETVSCIGSLVVRYVRLLPKRQCICWHTKREWHPWVPFDTCHRTRDGGTNVTLDGLPSKILNSNLVLNYAFVGFEVLRMSGIRNLWEVLLEGEGSLNHSVNSGVGLQFLLVKKRRRS